MMARRFFSAIAATSIAGLILAVSVTVRAQQAPGHFGLGRPATAADVRTRDIDVRPDGRGLPPGRGTAALGEAIFVTRCAACHGMKGEGLSAERLVGRTEGDSFAFATDSTLVRTVGSYWPYATTLFDYTRRAMPQPQPGSLTDSETYSLVAYLLFLNGIVAEDTVMDATSLPKAEMPARVRIVIDDRAGGPVVRKNTPHHPGIGSTATRPAGRVAADTIARLVRVIV
jgi:cytochrome c